VTLLVAVVARHCSRLSFLLGFWALSGHVAFTVAVVAGHGSSLWFWLWAVKCHVSFLVAISASWWWSLFLFGRISAASCHVSFLLAIVADDRLLRLWALASSMTFLSTVVANHRRFVLRAVLVSVF
jgi:hypothetical protein